MYVAMHRITVFCTLLLDWFTINHFTRGHFLCLNNEKTNIAEWKKLKFKRRLIMKINEIGNNKITASSALKRKSSAPQLVVVAPSGSGKSTLIYLLLNHRLIPYMQIGIGEKSQTTIIPCEFCFDERIENNETFAIQIIKKNYCSKDIHISILSVLMDLFGKYDCDTGDTLEAFDGKVFEQILEPEEAHYHLNKIKNEISLTDLLEALRPILNYIAENGFEAKVKQRKNDLKSKKVKLPEVREMIFEEMFEDMPDNIKTDYVKWLDRIGEIIERVLKDEVGEEILQNPIQQYNLDDDDKGTHVLETLFDPFAPYSLVIEYISIACRPRQELIEIAKSQELPFRFCIRDTMGLTQKGIDSETTKDSLEVALNCKADTILFLLSLDERDDTLTECCKALAEKKDELIKKRNLDIPVYVLFTKADRIVENLINKRNAGKLYIDENTYSENIQSVLTNIEEMVNLYADVLPKEEVGWLSMRYLKDSYVLKALEGDNRKRNFEPEGLFEKIVDYSMKTLSRSLPAEVKRPIFVTAIEPNKPAIQVQINPSMIKSEIDDIKYILSKNKDIVNGYVISDKTPRLHGRSVACYWNNLAIGLGHKTRASVYGNFSINMKGLLKRILYNAFASFTKFDENSAVKFTANNLEDDVLTEVLKTLLENNEMKLESNPALGEREMVLQALYEFYKKFFNDASIFALLIDRVAYDLSFGNPELKSRLTKIYNNTPSYDGAMRNLQAYFNSFFGSEDFTRILVDELNQLMTEMVNKSFIII